MNTKPITGIRTVNFFRDGRGRCCDRCGTFIKNVALVTYKDGESLSYGSECINKILSGDTTLKGLWRRNAKKLQHYQACLEILSRPEPQMTIGRRAINDDNGAFRFIADENGGWMMGGGVKYPSMSTHYFFHPMPMDVAAAKFTGARTFDMREAGLTAWEPYTLVNWQIKCRASIEDGKAWFQQEITKLSAFLGRILAKGLVTSKCSVPDCQNHAVATASISINNEPKHILPVCQCHADAAAEDSATPAAV